MGYPIYNASVIDPNDPSLLSTDPTDDTTYDPTTDLLPDPSVALKRRQALNDKRRALAERLVGRAGEIDGSSPQGPLRVTSVGSPVAGYIDSFVGQRQLDELDKKEEEQQSRFNKDDSAYRRQQIKLAMDEEERKQINAEKLAHIRSDWHDTPREFAPIRVEDDQGNVKLFSPTGELLKDLGKVGKTAREPRPLQPQSIVVQTVDANGQPVTSIVPKTIGSSYPRIPTTPSVPAHVSEAVAKNAASISNIDAALSAVDKNPNAVGYKGFIPDEALQRIDPEGVDARALISNIGSLKIHDRSGAAVTAAETPRLKPFIPSAKDNAETVKKKLNGLKAEAQRMDDEYRAAFPGTRPAASGSGSGKTIVKTGTLNGRKVVKYSDGTVGYAD